MNKEQFKAICRKTQEDLKPYLLSKLKKRYEKIWVCKDFIFAQGTVPICLVAHMDTVHKSLPFTIIEKEGKIISPQGIGGDDRCGIYAILQIIQKHNCSVLFCCDEETGGHGAVAFANSAIAKQQEFNFMIELDRKGMTDAVFYECDNPEFTEFIESFGYWREDYGSYTDICDVAPAIGCAAVNLSVGYYNQHTVKEYVVPEHVDYAIEGVCDLIAQTKPEDKFEYIESKWNKYYGRHYGSIYDYDSGWDDEYIVMYEDEDGHQNFEIIDAISDYEALGKFMAGHKTLTFMHIIDVSNYRYASKR